MKSLSSKIRITGLMYLIVIVCAGFAQGYVRANLVVPGDAAATAANILEYTPLFRLGLVADLIAFILDAVIYHALPNTEAIWQNFGHDLLRLALAGSPSHRSA